MRTLNTFYIYEYIHIVCTNTFTVIAYDIKCMFFLTESKDQKCVNNNRAIQFFSWLLKNEEGES